MLFGIGDLVVQEGLFFCVQFCSKVLSDDNAVQGEFAEDVVYDDK